MRPAIRTLLAAGLTVAGATNIAHADVVYADDLVIQGGACIGVDCVNNEVLTSVIKLRENNTRINFIDQTALPFDATNETAEYTISGSMNGAWRIDANESANGGRNAFIIRQQSLLAYPALSNGSAVDYDCSYTGTATAVGLIPEGQQVETQQWFYDPAAPDPTTTTDCQLLSSEVKLDGIILEGSSETSGAALGQQSVPADGTLSIGSTETLRRLVNIAAALEDVDLVTKGQFEQDVLTDERLADLRAQLRQIDRQVVQIERALGLAPIPKGKDGGAGSIIFLMMLALLGLRRRSL